MTKNERVVVVGAGPVGTVAALALARRGLDVTVVEADPEDRVRPGSRAIGLYGPTLKRLENIEPGLGHAVAQRGIQMTGGEAWYDGRRVFRTPLPQLDPTRALAVALPQPRVEELVHQAALDHGVEFRWATPLSGLKTTPDEVQLELESGELLTAAYVIGADGARSVVRSEVGRSLEGPRDDTPFIIVDVDEHPDGSTPTTPAYFHYRMPEIGGRNVMHMPFAGGMRIDLQCLPEDDAGHLASPEGLREWIAPVVGDWHADHIQWVSTYVFHQAVVDSLTDQHHRVLLAGEAAHLFAPWGGRGFNSGVIDATDAAVAIGKAVADPRRAAGYIQRCADDRRKWAIHNRDLSSRALRQMRADDPTMRITRDLAAKVSPVFLPAGAWLASAPIQPFVPWPWAKSHY